MEGNKRNNVAIKLGEIAIAVSFRVRICNFFLSQAGRHCQKVCMMDELGQVL